jgi:hypothetical protein
MTEALPRRRWPWKSALGLLVVGAAAATVYLAYPSPEELMARSWSLRTEFLASVRSGSHQEADRILGEWRSANSQLPTAVLLRTGRRDADVRAKSDSLEHRLSELQYGIAGDSAEVQELTLAALDAHRDCAAIFYPTPPAPAAEDLQAMPACHVGHQHPMLEVPEDLPAPTLAVTIAADAKTGWNLHLETTEFRFAPEHASQDHQPGEGHAHLYIDGVKIARVYGPWYHIASLSPGEHVILVTLNANSHDDLAVDGKIISAEQTIVVPDDRATAYFGNDQPGASEAPEPNAPETNP